MNVIFRPLAALACLAAFVFGGAGLAQAQGTPKRGGTAVIGVSVVGATLNTQLTSAVTPLIIADLWADGLYKYDKTGGKKPQLASSWDISKDGKVYTFHLRPNLKWSDGHPFSSEDFAFTLSAFAKFNTYLVKVLPNIDHAETPDANTFVVYLKEPQSSALEAFDKEIFPVMPKHIYGGKDIPSNDANRAPVGMGPFKFVKWEEGRGITFDRNEYYWDQPKPYLDSVVAVFIPAVQQQQNALYRGEIDVLRPALPQVGRTIEQAKAKNAFEVREIKVNAAERLSLDVNITREIFNKPLVRQALLVGIDRERISKDVYQGLAFPAMNAIPEQFPMLTDTSVDYNKQFAYDPVKAGKMLDEAGYPLKDGKRFALNFLAAVNADAFYAEPSAQIPGDGGEHRRLVVDRNDRGPARALGLGAGRRALLVLGNRHQEYPWSIGDGGIFVWPVTCGRTIPTSSTKHQLHCSPGSSDRMIGCSLDRACPEACWPGESSQQPTWPQSRQMRRCNQTPPSRRQSSQPSTVAGSSVISIVFRWVQLGSFALMD